MYIIYKAENTFKCTYLSCSHTDRHYISIYYYIHFIGIKKRIYIENRD